MKIIMNETVPGSIDGIHSKSYDAGTTHDLTGSRGARELATAFVGAGLAVEVDDAVEQPATENLATPVPESQPAANAPRAAKLKRK